MSRYQTKKFKQLQNHWYQILKKEGFEDIEDTESENEYLRVWHSSHFEKRFNEVSFGAKEEYFSLAGQFLETFDFETSRQKRIWEMHAEGASLRRIARELRTKVCRVHKVVKLLSSRMLEKQSPKRQGT